MNRLLSHIEFLLHDHNCVVVPDFGGFVVNTVPPRKDGIATFHAPVCESVFNRDLTHNDGLLAQSYMKYGNVTFESAMQKIEEDVQDLKRQLQEQRQLDMGKLGSFAMHDEKRFVFTPGSFVRPSFFGLTQANLRPLLQIQPPVLVRHGESPRSRWRHFAEVSAAAIAVVLLVFFLPAGDTALKHQSAKMISETGWSFPNLFRKVFTSDIANESTIETVNETIPETGRETSAGISGKTRAEMPGEPENEASTGTNQFPMAGDAIAPVPGITGSDGTDNLSEYYIVMGVFSCVETARKVTQRLVDEGFPQAGWLERPGRFDIYSASFTDKNMAEVYIKEIHRKFPGHSDAWILKK